MGILNRVAATLGYERRGALGVNGWTVAGPLSSAGYAVTATLAENQGTVTACINAIAGTIASLPVAVYRSTGDGRAEDTAHPVSRLIRRPNDHQTWPDWMEMMTGDVLLHGNALSVIETDGAGRPVALIPVAWRSVTPRLTPSGRLAFDIIWPMTPAGTTGQTRRFFEGEVFHLKDRSDNGWLGRSRISRAPEVLGNAAALQEYNGAMWQNQATPSGAIEIQANLQKEQFERLRAQFETVYAGAHNARKAMILDNGASWKPLSLSPEDAEVLASRRFSVEELCRLFQVPPPIVQDYTHNTFTNSQQAALWFAQFSLMPWVRKIEAEFQRSVFGSGSADRSLEIDMSGLTR